MVNFYHPVFQAACREIEMLGFRISCTPFPGGEPYAVIGGRSNARWWLVPLNNHRVTISGMALFQPVVTSAKVLKAVAVTASSLGLSALWARKKVYISGASSLADIFGANGLHYAFFTGTDSPHRKVAVQIMDRDGKIKGFAKVSRNPLVKPLLAHEAETLNYLHTLGLKTVLVPSVLFCGVIGGADVLVTDTLKTERTKSTTMLNGAHIAFLQELAEKTADSDTDGSNWYGAELRTRLEMVSDRLPEDWRRRLEKAIDVAVDHGTWGPRTLSHGDFTPWNTFIVDGRLYVFDWEYAAQKYPVGYDLIHYTLSLPSVRHQPVSETIGQVREVLRKANIAGDDRSADALLICYLCGHSLHYIARELKVDCKIVRWDGERESAVLLDAVVERMN